jgi:hypothetical protein
MKINLSDKIIAWLALLSGLTISAVAIWYSVAGLVSIFAAAMIPIIVMGVALEVSKLIATVWLKLNWTKAPVFIRTYLLIAIAILMLITSMGIFGFLSKAHSDQSLVSGDVQSRIAIYDEQIKTEKDNIEANRKQLSQMDEAVDQVMARSKDERGANNANAIRTRQNADRKRIAAEITASQKKIQELNAQRAPIAAEVRKVEAEVGPIKYIANFIYGDNPDANVLEKAVTWVIIIIVSVFDPLAVILLLASQYSFQWFRKAREEEEENKSKSINDFVSQPQELVVDKTEIKEPFISEPKEESILEKHPYLNKGDFWKKPDGWVDVPPQVYKPEDTVIVPEKEEVQQSYQIEDADEEPVEDIDEELFNPDDSAEIKAAKTAWKHDHPTDNLKRHKKLFEKGLISQLPWEHYLSNPKEISDNEAAIEAAKWAQEQLDERPGDYINTPETYMENIDGQQVKKPIDDGYVQNAEQNSSTIWNRVKKAKGE